MSYLFFTTQISARLQAERMASEKYPERAAIQPQAHEQGERVEG